jgi:serine/threonine protein kinase
MGCMEEKNGDVCPSPKICGWIEGSPALSVDQLSPRTVLIDRYVLGRALGHGAFGITYVAWDLTDERKIAIKEYFPRNVAGRSTDRTTVVPYANVRQAAFHSGLRKFTDEAQELKRMGNRSGLVTILKAFETNGTCYTAMDFLIGETLAKRLEETPQGRLSFYEVLGILILPMEALIELHKNGLFHLDINPNHVCVSGSSGKLLDFGGAKRATRFSELTMQVWGLNGFLALEQFGNRRPQGAFTDIYALGATFYFCLTGVVPAPPMDRLDQDDLKPPSELGVDLPERSEMAIIRALSVRVEDRYDDLEDFRRDVDPDSQGSRPRDILRPQASTDAQKRVRIFLCHSSRDKGAVRRLYWRLRRDHLDPWFDEQKLLPGQNWESEIRKAVRCANLIIVCLSSASVGKGGYLHREIRFALDAATEQPPDAIYLIPARLDNVEVPEDLSKWQWVNLFEDSGYDRLMMAINNKASCL